jgi:hypothetical protein
MKKTISISLIAVAFYSCGNSEQNKAVVLAKEIQSTVKAGATPTTSSGYTMKATLDGKSWTATAMMPPDAVGRIVGYYNNEYVGLPYDRRNMQAGKKILIDENNAIDISTGNGCLWKDAKGTIEITIADETTAEGKFSFTATCSNTGKPIEVSDGFFRVLFTKNQ